MKLRPGQARIPRHARTHKHRTKEVTAISSSPQAVLINNVVDKEDRVKFKGTVK